MTDLHHAFSIKKKIKESDLVTTFILDWNIACTPGQFFMVWLKWVDEKPISIWYVYENHFALTVAAIWPFTKKLNELNQWENMFLRWPFWSWFDLAFWEHYIAIWWWVGVPPVAFASQELRKKNITVDFIQWARSISSIIYKQFLEWIWCNVHICTDDWSEGFHWFTTEKFSSLLWKYSDKWIKISNVISCGPELMMKKVAEISKNKKIPCQLSVERYMKCGFWVCWQCAIDWTWDLACKNWPVFDWEELLKSNEFWFYSRDWTWKKNFFKK